MKSLTISIFFSILTTCIFLSFLVPIVLAAALPSDLFIAEQLGKPKNCEKAGLYICTDTHWTGNCTYHHPCIGAANSEATCLQLDGKASSIGPDEGFVCSFYRNGMCRDLADDGILRVIYPGYDNLFETDMGNWNDEVRGEEGKH